MLKNRNIDDYLITKKKECYILQNYPIHSFALILKGVPPPPFSNFFDLQPPRKSQEFNFRYLKWRGGGIKTISFLQVINENQHG